MSRSFVSRISPSRLCFWKPYKAPSEALFLRQHQVFRSAKPHEVHQSLLRGLVSEGQHRLRRSFPMESSIKANSEALYLRGHLAGVLSCGSIVKARSEALFLRFHTFILSFCIKANPEALFLGQWTRRDCGNNAPWSKANPEASFLGQPLAITFNVELKPIQRPCFWNAAFRCDSLVLKPI